MNETFLKKIAEAYHNNISSCYQSQRASWRIGGGAVSQTEWVKDKRGKWNGYPPARWVDPAVCLLHDNKTIKISTFRNKAVLIPIPKVKPEKMIFNIVFKGCLFSVIRPDGLHSFGLKKGAFVEMGFQPNPPGYKFGQDKNGVKLYSVKNYRDDYHLHNVWFPLTKVETLIEKLEQNRALREKTKLEEKKNKEIYKKCIKSGVKVVLSDAVRAGNCMFGIESFCRRFFLKLGKAYSPLFLQRLKASQEEKRRLRLSVSSAVKRHHNLTAFGAEIFYPSSC